MNPRYVVTAAHCLFFDQAGTQPMAPSDVTVTLGEHDRSQIMSFMIINFESRSTSGEGNIAEKTVNIAKIFTSVYILSSSD